MNRNIRSFVYTVLIFATVLNFSACGRISDRAREVVSEEEYNGKENGTKEITVEEDPNDNYLYPYARSEGFNVMYGYADSSGKIAIEPVFKYAEPFFQCGLAPVTTTDDKTGLIDITGKYVIDPEWNYISYSEGTFMCYTFEYDCLHVYDETGTLLFEHYGFYTEGFSEGLFPSHKEFKKGYLDKNGELVIPLDYTILGGFVNGIAEVAQSWAGPSHFIDKNGNDLTDTVSSGLRMYKDESTSLFGYKNDKGEIAIPAVYKEAAPFLNGYAIVNISELYDEKYGVIDTMGNYVLEPVYCGIRRLSNGLVAVGEKFSDDVFVPYGYSEYCRKALFTPDFKKSTDWIYYTVSDFDDENVCVSDGENIVFIDKTLSKSGSLPAIKGSGWFARDKDMLRGYCNGKLTVIDKNGRIITQASGNIDLGGGLISENQIKMPSPAATIAFPALTGMKDRKLQETINKLIVAEIVAPYEKFASFDGPNDTTLLDAGYTLSKIKDLLMIDQNGYMYFLGAIHDYSFRNTVYIDLTTGEQYGLSDLFRKDSGAWDYLSNAVTAQMQKNADDIYLVESVTIDPYSKFALNDSGIDFYFEGGDIAAFAAGMQVFHIPYSDLTDYIDTEGAFWKAFN